MKDLNVVILSELGESPHGVSAIILRNMVNKNNNGISIARHTISIRLQFLKRRGLVEYNGSRWMLTQNQARN